MELNYAEKTYYILLEIKVQELIVLSDVRLKKRKGLHLFPRNHDVLYFSTHGTAGSEVQMFLGAFQEQEEQFEKRKR